MIDLLTREESIAASGVALVMPQLRGLQPEGDKKGSNAKAAYATPAQATKFLIERVEEAKSIDEVLELYANAQIALILADPDALNSGSATSTTPTARSRRSSLRRSKRSPPAFSQAEKAGQGGLTQAGSADSVGPTYGAQGKTVDRAYPLLDGSASLEQGLVAISRGREIASVYVVASSELLDPDLGPGKREIGDSLHDLRVAIEREGNDYAAAEFSLRQSIERMPDYELVKQRAELAAVGRAAVPVLDAREKLFRAVENGKYWSQALDRERQALEAMSALPPEELARVAAAERGVNERLQRNEARLAALPESDPNAVPLPPEPHLRLEASLIGNRIERLARRDVEAARLEPKPVFYKNPRSLPIRRAAPSSHLAGRSARHRDLPSPSWSSPRHRATGDAPEESGRAGRMDGITARHRACSA